MDHLVEIAADQVRNVAEDRPRDRVHRGDAEVLVDEVHAERRLVEQRLELRARLVRPRDAARPSCTSVPTRTSSSRELNGLTR